jgi:hypothetical protein
MLIGPAEITDRPEIDKADFQFAGGISVQRRGGDSEEDDRSGDIPLFHGPAPDW